MSEIKNRADHSAKPALFAIGTTSRDWQIVRHPFPLPEPDASACSIARKLDAASVTQAILCATVVRSERAITGVA